MRSLSHIFPRIPTAAEDPVLLMIQQVILAGPGTGASPPTLQPQLLVVGGLRNLVDKEALD